jgi:chloramphenicol 3-O-phosphotransferase
LLNDPSPCSPAPRSPALRVAVVGPCASGKSTLTAALRAAGYEARMPAQEHSYVPDMWRRLVDPDVLIYLDISYEALLERRPHFGEQEYLEREKARLAHARAHADLVVDTSELAAEEVRRRVLAALPSETRDAT